YHPARQTMAPDRHIRTEFLNRHFVTSVQIQAPALYPDFVAYRSYENRAVLLHPALHLHTPHVTWPPDIPMSVILFSSFQQSSLLFTTFHRCNGAESMRPYPDPAQQYH